MGLGESPSRLRGSHLDGGIGGWNLGRPFPPHGRVTNVLPENLVKLLTDIHHIDSLFGVQGHKEGKFPPPVN